MATVTTATGTLAPTMKTYYDRKLLERLTPEMVFTRWAKKKPIPANNGKRMQFRRMQSLAPATTPLTEGVTPVGNTASMTELFVELAQYGDYTEFSDVLDLTAYDPIIDEQTDVHADQADQTIEVVVRDVLNSGTNVQYANGKTARAQLTAADKLTVAELRKAKRTMKRASVKPAEGNDYIAIVEPGAAYDIMDDPNWKDVNTYVSVDNQIKGEVGRIHGVRIVESNLVKMFAGAGAGGADVYTTIFLGREAYGMSDITGSGAPQTIVKSLGSAGTADPLDQRSTVGWKCMFGTIILEQAALIRIEHGISG